MSSAGKSAQLASRQRSEQRSVTTGLVGKREGGWAAYKAGQVRFASQRQEGATARQVAREQLDGVRDVVLREAQVVDPDHGLAVILPSELHAPRGERLKLAVWVIRPGML